MRSTRSLPEHGVALRHRLSSRFVASVLAILVPVVVVQVAVADRLGTDGLRDAARAGLTNSAAEKRAAISAWRDDRRDAVAVVAGEPVMRSLVARAVAGPAAAWNEVRELLRLRLRASGFTELFVLEPDSGRITAATEPGDEGTLREDREYFLEGRRHAYVQPVYYSAHLRAAAMTAAAPIRHPRSLSVVGVLAGRVDLPVLQAILNRGAGRSSSDAFLVNPSGLFVSQPRFWPEPAAFRLTTRLPDVARCLAGTSGFAEGPDYREVNALTVLMWLPEMQACLVVKVDRAEALGPARDLTERLAWAGVVSGAAGVGLALLLSASIARRLRPVRAGLEALGRGERGVRIQPGGHDELAALGHAFDDMADAVSDGEARLLEHARMLQAANTELDAFAYSVSHDLRAPLRAIDGFSRSVVRALGEEVDPQIRDDLGRVCRAAGHMGELIDDLLRLSRISRAALVPQAVDVTALAHDVATELARHDPARSVEVEVEDGMTVEADPSLLRIVFENLLGNAWKFTRPAEHPEVHVGSTTHDGFIDVCVSDNGAGFDPAYTDKLFRPFERLHSAAEYEGSGIGLATVQRIIGRHGGSVQAAAELGHGAAFTISLPRRSR